MKRILYILLISALSTNLFAQNEGRIGVFAGVNKTSLVNSKDKAWGDYLPTFKPTIGVDAGYHFTLFKTLPMGISFQFSNSKAGQNYYGEYEDSTSYYAYSRLNYLRPGLALHFGSNPRRLVSFTFSAGATMGILTNYQERYELIRYNNERMYFDIKNNDVIWYDTVKTRGTLTSQMYNKTDPTVFATLGFDVLLTKKVVFGVYGRYDAGMSQVENRNKMTINFDTEPKTSIPFQPYDVDIKYRDPVDATKFKREDTKNQLYGVYVSLKYRIFNPEKVEFWYKEHKWE
jgi:hypothetical protein